MSRAAPDEERLAKAIERHLGQTAPIENLRRLSGGASRETWSFDAALPGGARAGLVLRRDPGGHSDEPGRATEYELLAAARAGGVAVPEVRFLLEPADELGSGFVMERVEGETIARRILRDDVYVEAHPRMARQCGEQAARIHALDPYRLPLVPRQTPTDQLEQFRALLDGFGEPHPAFELGMRWLGERVPETRAATLVHGDFRNGNFVVGPDGLRAVLDWELAHVGDPIEDLGWLCVKSWRFGVNDHRVGGFGDVEDLLDGYRAAGGGDVDLGALRFWEAFGNLKWGVICKMQAFTHLVGTVRSVELAAIGRRVPETEWDLLELIA